MTPKAAPPPAANVARSPASSNVNVVSFNVAGGASGFKLEEKLSDTPLFQKLIKGDPDAPIVACQETTPALAKKLIEESKNGNFQVLYPGQAWMPKGVPTSTLMQGNMLLVPKRYQVQKSESHTFSGRAEKAFGAVKNLLFHHGRANDVLLALQNRGYISASLKDTQTGKSFSVVATHIAYDDAIRRDETPQLVAAIKKAQAKGPTVVMGDFNIPTLEARPDQGQGGRDFWKELEPLLLKDMGPTGKDRVSFWKNGADIDSVLATGFQSVSQEMLTGQKMTIPGRPDARQVSDHFAEADSLKFE
jgi:endonuclease/exonuclease/phosphatase family metal-dependent hydrolase